MARNVPVGLQQNVIRETHDALQLAMPQMLAGAIGQAGKEIPKIVQAMGQALDLKVIPKDRMRAANIRIAEMAHASVVRGWRSRLPAHTPPGGSEKHLSGHLGRALADPGMTLYTTADYISFINTDILDSEAEHWYRVNYGAAGSRYSEGRKPSRFVVQLGGSAIGSFRDDRPPDPKSWLPKVFVMHDDGSLFPKSTEVRPSDSGARAAHFFDLGYAKIVREAPRIYEAEWRRYLGEKSGAAQQKMAKKNMTFTGDWRATRVSWTGRVRRG